MNLEECLEILKGKGYGVYVYPMGCHESKDDPIIDMFKLERDDNGELPPYKYQNAIVREIIPFASAANIVVEIPHDF